MDMGGFIRKKCKRYNVPWDPHALTFSCYKGRALLGQDRTREHLARAIRLAKKAHGFNVWAYVIMPEHVHLLILPRADNYSISRILQSIKQPVARKAIAYLRKNRPEELKSLTTGQKGRPYRFWQDGGGYDRNVRSSDELKNVFDYIHYNPVRRGLVEAPEDWAWSSCPDWKGLGEGPIPLDKESYWHSMV